MPKKSLFLFIPFILIIAMIPLFVSGRQYDPELADNMWYSINTVSYDFFLFWKARSVMIVGVFVVFISAFGLRKQEVRRSVASFVKENLAITICLSTYFAAAFFSSIFAENRSMAFWGGYEQFEGAFVLFTYALISFYTFYILIDVEKRCNKDILSFLYNIILIGTGIISLIGLSQFFSADFFGSDLGKDIMRLMEPTLAGMDFNFNFEPGRVYLTLYNPNYVGTYVALLLPIVLGGAFSIKYVWIRAAFFVVTFSLILSLIGSESITGYIAIISSIILLFILLILTVKTNRKVTFGVFGLGILLITSVAMTKPDAIQYAYNKVVHSPENDYAVEKFEAAEGRLFVYSHGSRMEVTENAQTAASDFTRFSFIKSSYTDINDKAYEGYEVKVDGHTWNFVLDNGEYKFFNVFQRVVPIRVIPSLGFEKHQHFGSRRGYIWSRTFPLIQKYILLGAGPDHFVTAFPNDDYVGLENNNYRGNILTKPHNMYMQIAIQTGLVSFIAFITFYLIYFVQSMKLYLRAKQYGEWDIMGISIFLGTFGYMVTGITNDSTITVAPVFWTLMGAGLAINRIIKKTDG